MTITRKGNLKNDKSEKDASGKKDNSEKESSEQL